MPFYAVRIGKRPGIYSTWEDCSAQVHKFSGAQYKKFDSKEEALNFIKGKSHLDNCSKDLFHQRRQAMASSSAPLQSSNTTNMLPDKSIKESASQSGKFQEMITAPLPCPVSKSDSVPCLTSVKLIRDDADPERVVVYTDGACSNNGQSRPRAGVGVFWGHDHPWNVSARWNGEQTNNRAEIGAICIALRQIRAAGLKKLTVRTDSQFVINCITKWISGWHKNNWRLKDGTPVKVKREIEQLWCLWKEDGALDIKWEHVRGHSSDEGNTEADRLAVRGATLPFQGNPFDDSDSDGTA